MRQLIVTRAEQGWTYGRIATALGISVRTVAKWRARSRQADGLSDGSSRPHRQPRRLAAPLEAAIVTLRRTRATAWQISTALRLPRSTVTRVLARAGLNRLALLEPSAPVQR
jgi:transposase